MFDFDQPLLVAGFLLGLASSIHCMGMCSGIAASLNFIACRGRSPRTLYVSTVLINVGRIAGYVIAGAVVGVLGSAVFRAFNLAPIHAVLRWAAAVALGWIGLSMLGLAPVPALADRAAHTIGALTSRVAGAARLPQNVRFVMGGALWGCTPCAMVYGTLFYAMLSGSALGGALVMLGFGLGTAPAVMGAGFVFPMLYRHAGSPWLRSGVGLFMIVAGVLSAILRPAEIASWCGLG